MYLSYHGAHKPFSSWVRCELQMHRGAILSSQQRGGRGQEGHAPEEKGRFCEISRQKVGALSLHLLVRSGGPCPAGSVGLCESLPLSSSLRKQRMHLLLRTGHMGKVTARTQRIYSLVVFPSKENLFLTHLFGESKKQKQMVGTRKNGLSLLDFLLALEPYYGASKNLLSSRNVSHLPTSQARRHGG